MHSEIFMDQSESSVIVPNVNDGFELILVELTFFYKEFEIETCL